MNLKEYEKTNCKHCNKVILKHLDGFRLNREYKFCNIYCYEKWIKKEIKSEILHLILANIWDYTCEVDQCLVKTLEFIKWLKKELSEK